MPEAELEIGFKLISKSVPDLTFLMDSDGTILNTSALPLRRYGFNKKDFLGKNITELEFLSPNDKRVIKRNLAHRLKGKKITPYEISLYTKDGEERFFEVNASFIKSGEKTLGIALLRDITEHKETEELYRTLAVSSPIGVYIIQDKKFVFVNPAFRRQTGLTKDDLLGTDPFNLVFPEDRDMVRKNAIQMLKGKRSSPYEYRFVRKNGELGWVMERIVSIQHHRRRATLGYFMDITNRKKIEQTLRESEREWRKILNSLDDLVLLIDTKHNILQINKSVTELVKKPEKEIIGQKCYQVLHHANEPLANCPLARFLETGNMETFNYYEPAFDKHFSVKTTPILGKKNEAVEFIDLLRDTTDQKKAEEQAKKSYEDTVLSMAIALEARDPYTRGHSDRVKRYCRAIARQMGLPAKQIGELERAASLHDIGKIAVPDAILSKPEPLTPPEFAQVQLHPEKSVDLIRLIPNPEDTLLAIRHHHERVNGKGYPDGLSGDTIPLEACILAVADAYDALTSERPYRKSFTHENALQILKENAGTQWDAKVVEAAIEALSEKK